MTIKVEQPQTVLDDVSGRCVADPATAIPDPRWRVALNRPRLGEGTLPHSVQPDLFLSTPQVWQMVLPVLPPSAGLTAG